MNPFTTYQFRKMPVRIVRKSDKNYFVIRDICNILGWSNPNRELAKHTENVPLYERSRTPGGLQVVRLVPRADGEIAIASYMNFLIVNGGIILPQYGDENDALAVQQVQAMFPVRRVVGVQTREVAFGGGNIHCITQQQPGPRKEAP